MICHHSLSTQCPALTVSPTSTWGNLLCATSTSTLQKHLQASHPALSMRPVQIIPLFLGEISSPALEPYLLTHCHPQPRKLLLSPFIIHQNPAQLLTCTMKKNPAQILPHPCVRPHLQILLRPFQSPQIDPGFLPLLNHSSSPEHLKCHIVLTTLCHHTRVLMCKPWPCSSIRSLRGQELSLVVLYISPTHSLSHCL